MTDEAGETSQQEQIRWECPRDVCSGYVRSRESSETTESGIDEPTVICSECGVVFGVVFVDEPNETQSVVVNRQYGVFSLSERAVRWLRDRGVDWADEVILPGETLSNGTVREDNGQDKYAIGIDVPRNDPHLVECIETLGEAAGNQFCSPVVVDVPAGVEWMLEEYDGWEWVAERHRTWPDDRFGGGQSGH